MGQSGRQILLRLEQRNAAREATRFATGVLSANARRPWWMRATASVMAVVTYLSPLLVLFDEIAQAAPIVDPRAPIQFQPTVTQTSTGVPAVNIAAPNSNGISVNSFQTFNVDSGGLVLNNSLVSGTPLLGGTLGANPNLAGRAASTIVGQVTSSGSASALLGILEVFGTPANVIISNPNGISVNGLSLTNVPGLVLTTGTPQFLTGVGGTSTSFANAGALAYNVTSGNITINGPSGVNGPGAGIEGTVGNIDVIAQTINLNAPLLADQRVNLIAGNQLVSPTSDTTGATYGTASNGTANTATAIGNGNTAIDANQYGSVTSGQIYIVSTPAGMGVNAQGALAATAGNVSVSSNGDITVGNTFANQNVTLASTGTAGNVTIGGTGLGNQNYTVTTNGDINATGSVSAGQNVSMSAGGDVSAASVSASGSVNLLAGGSMSLGPLSGTTLDLQATTGNLTLGQSVSAPGTITASAGHNLTVNGAVQGGSTVMLTAGQNATVNGSVAGVGNVTLTAQNGTAQVVGNLQTNGVLTVTAGQSATLDGITQAQGPVVITAQAGTLSGTGAIASSQGAVSLNAGQNIELGGSIQSASMLTAIAGGNASLAGNVTAPDAIAVQAGGNATLGGNVTGGSTLTVAAGGSATIQGAVASVGDMSLGAAGGTLSTTGNVTTTGALSASGQQGVNLGGTVSSQGNATLSSGAGDVTVSGALTTPGTIAITAGQDVTVAGQVHSGQSTTITTARDAALNGGIEVDGTGNATVSAGRDLTGSGAVSVANNTTLSAGRNLSVSGAIQTGNNLSATAAQNLSVGATTAVGTATLTATSGSATLGGNALSGGNMQVTAGTSVSAQGSVQSLGNLNLNARGGNLGTSSTVSTAGTATLNAGQNMTLGGQTTVSGNATLTGNNITTQGLAVGGNLVANATNNLDTSAGQLNAAFSASAPALSVTGNATLSGATVTTANASISGTYSATGTTSLTTGGTAAYQGNATLAGGAVTNVGQQMAAGNLTVSGSTVTNQGELSSLQTMTVNAANLGNSGSIYGPTNNLNVSNGTTNSGGLLATNTLTLTTNSLNNSNGMIFAGDTSNPDAQVGNVTVNVNGGNGSFANTSGQILAQNFLTVNLPNQTIDPSAATYGTLNGGSAFNLSAQGISNSGSWTLPGTAVTVTAGSISNSGTINQGTGTLALNGAVTNSGSVTANDLTINGSLANQAGATVQANDALSITGSGASTNAGTVEAANTLNVTGASYDNSNGITKAGNSSSAAGSGNLNINLSGDLGNAGGTIAATNDLAITAHNVNNSAVSSTTTTTTTTTVTNAPLLDATVIGTETFYAVVKEGKDGGDQYLVWTEVPATIGGLLSSTGNVPGANATWVNPGGLAFGVGTFTQGAPTVSSGNAQFVEVPTQVGTSNNENGTPIYENLWTVQDGTVTGASATQAVPLPTVTETTTTTSGTAGAASVIAAGHNLSVTANSLNNEGGTVSAGNDANLNIQSLSNGGPSYSSRVTDSVDTASLNAFLSTLQAMQTSGAVTVADNVPLATGCATGNESYCMQMPPISFAFDAPGAATSLSVSSSVTVQGQTGQIVAAHNLNLSGGNLTNAGTLAAGNDMNITASSFTNQGTNTGTMTTTAGCASGYSAGCSSLATTNPNSQTYSYQQTNSTVTAGNDIVIATNTVNNTYGTLAAGRNVVIGGTGTSASDSSTTPTNLAQAANVTNTSGSIAAGNDVDINAATLINTIAEPVQVHQNYGSATPFTGCSDNCEAYVDVQSAAPATITANHNVNLTAVGFSNTGSLVTALNNVAINASSSAASNNQYLYAYWSSGFDRVGTAYATWGCANDASLCQTLYGSDYSSSAPQDPAGLPSSVGLSDFVPATIQAGNTLSVNSPTLTNTGNVVGQSVALSGSQLVNGLTNPNVYTPPPAISGQVISLGPPAVPGSATTTVNRAGLVTTLGSQPTSVTGAAGLPSSTPIGVQTVGKPVAPTTSTVNSPVTTSVKTVGGQTETVSYLVSSPASQVINDMGPATLLSALPASLQPSTTQFYYDPYTQAQQVEQAALEATGNSSFYSTTSATDSTSLTSINNQDTQALYGAALQYAEQHNIALGTQLSAAQLALVNEPMLWYTEETVPEPGCAATGNGACPTVQALMPEVLLPQNYTSVNADGAISGTNVSLNYSNSVLNTGSISANGTLSVNTGTLTNEERSTNVGTIYTQLSNGIEVTTGTVVQQGGYMSAMNYDMNAQAIDNIGGAIEQVNADGSVNQAATSQLLSNLKSQLGSSFTQSTVSNNLNTTFIADPSGGWQGELFELVAVAMVSVMTAGAGAALVGAAAGTVEAGVANAAVTALASSVTSDAVSGNFSLSGIAESMAVAMVTAGLTNGITYNTNTGSLGLGNWDTPLGSGVSTLGQLAGVAPAVGSSTVSTATATLANLPTQALAIAGEATIQAGVQTAIEGGSFLNALKNDAVSDVAAAAAYDIGTAFNGEPGSLGTTSDPAYVLAHAALGCAASAAEGTGCAGGAIGAAASALITPYLVSEGGGAANLTDEQRAAIVAMATLLGGGVAGALGQNSVAGATAAENEALNNGTLDHRSEEQKEIDEEREEFSKMDARAGLSSREIIGYDEFGNPITIFTPPAALVGGASNAASNAGGLVPGFNATESAIIGEAQGILSSPQLAEIQNAYAASQPLTVSIGGRTIQYEPNLPASGMTMFGEDGFLIGPEAFSSSDEFKQTILHELYRLNTSASADGVSGSLATQETNAAASFAAKALSALKGIIGL